jgi:hypothetical protein
MTIGFLSIERFQSLSHRLRVAAVVRDYGMNQRDGAPDDSRRVHAAR